MAEQWLEDEFNLTDKDMENFREALLKYTNPSAIKIIGIFGLTGMKYLCESLDLLPNLNNLLSMKIPISMMNVLNF